MSDDIEINEIVIGGPGGGEGASVTGLPITIDGCRNLLTYSRESSEKQIGLHGQEEEIREWAVLNGYQIVGHARDLKVHGQSPPNQRPGLSGAISAVCDGQVNGIVVHRLDRLSRDFPTQDDAMHQIWDAGGRVFSTDYGEWKPDRPGDPQWRLRRDYARMAEDVLHDVIARLQGGRNRKAARGGYVGGQRLCRRYGVELVQIQGRWEYRPIPAEQQVIRRICVACPDGRGYAAMARVLNAEGIPTATGTAPWCTKTVRGLALRGPDRPVAIPDELPTARTIEWVNVAAG